MQFFKSLQIWEKILAIALVIVSLISPFTFAEIYLYFRPNSQISRMLLLGVGLAFLAFLWLICAVVKLIKDLLTSKNQIISEQQQHEEIKRQYEIQLLKAKNEQAIIMANREKIDLFLRAAAEYFSQDDNEMYYDFDLEKRFWAAYSSAMAVVSEEARSLMKAMRNSSSKHNWNPQNGIRLLEDFAEIVYNADAQSG